MRYKNKWEKTLYVKTQIKVLNSKPKIKQRVPPKKRIWKWRYVFLSTDATIRLRMPLVKWLKKKKREQEELERQESRAKAEKRRTRSKSCDASVHLQTRRNSRYTNLMIQNRMHHFIDKTVLSLFPTSFSWRDKKGQKADKMIFTVLCHQQTDLFIWILFNRIVLKADKL